MEKIYNDKESNQYINNVNHFLQLTKDKYAKDFEQKHPPILPYPVDYEFNNNPLFDKGIKDIVEDQYEKKRVNKIHITSNNRNKSIYLSPNNYEIFLSKEYYNVLQIKLKDFQISNYFLPINTYNNILNWNYPTLEQWISQELYLNIPLFNELVAITAGVLFNIQLSYQALSFVPTSNLMGYNGNITIGYYETQSLTGSIENSMNNIQNQYQYDNVPPYFKCFISPITHQVEFANLWENISIAAIQIFDSTTSFDPFLTFSNYPLKAKDNNLLYITFPLNSIITSSWTSVSSLHPLLLNFNCKSKKYVDPSFFNIGNYNISSFFWKLYWNEACYTNYGITTNQLQSVSTYILWDTLTFTNTAGQTVKYVRFAFKPVQNTTTNFEYTFKSNETQIYDTYLAQLTNCNLYISQPYTLSCGRSQMFNFINPYSINNPIKPNPKKSLLTILGWTLPYNINTNYQFIQNNYNVDGLPYIINNDYVLATDANDTVKITNENLIDFNSPLSKLNIEYKDGYYFFRSEPFIYVRILPKLQKNTINNYIQIANSTERTNEEQSYYNDLTVPNNEIENEIARFNLKPYIENELLCKIVLNPIPQKILNIYPINDIILYNQPLDQLSSIVIQILDSTGKILSYGIDHNFTLEIIETQMILKETLIDTRHNNVVTSGVKFK